jgi:hypothetical protein
MWEILTKEIDRGLIIFKFSALKVFKQFCQNLNFLNTECSGLRANFSDNQSSTVEFSNKDLAVVPGQ